MKQVDYLNINGEKYEIISPTLKEALDTKLTQPYVNNYEEACISDSAEGMIKNLQVRGKSIQVKTKGYNLFDIYNTVDGYVTESDGSVHPQSSTRFNEKMGDYISIKDGETHLSWYCKVTVSNDIIWVGIGFYDENEEFIKRYSFYSNTTTGIATSQNSLEIPENARYMRISFRKYSDGILQVEYGETVHEYEPYTGTIPSPNPDYPQEIKSIETLNIKICGKNIYDLNRKDDYIGHDVNPFVNGIATSSITNIQIPLSYYIKPFIGKQATISFDIRCDINTDIKVYPYQNQGVSVYFSEEICKVGNEWKRYSVTGDILDRPLNNVGNYGRIIFYNADLNGENLQIKNFQIEIGTEATSYEPYKEQVVSITPPFSLKSSLDGTVYDYIDVDRGKYVQRFFSINLTDFPLSEYQMTPNSSYQSEYSYNFWVSVFSTYNKYIESFVAINKILPQVKYVWSITDTFGITVNENYQLHVRLPNIITGVEYGTDDVLTAKEKIYDYIQSLNGSGNEFVYVVLAEPIEYDIPQEDLNKLKSLKTYFNITNILTPPHSKSRLITNLICKRGITR